MRNKLEVISFQPPLAHPFHTKYLECNVEDELAALFECLAVFILKLLVRLFLDLVFEQWHSLLKNYTVH